MWVWKSRVVHLSSTRSLALLLGEVAWVDDGEPALHSTEVLYVHGPVRSDNAETTAWFGTSRSAQPT